MNIKELEALPTIEQIAWYKEPTNLLFLGSTTQQQIYDELFKDLPQSPSEDIQLKKWRKCWEEASELNFVDKAEPSVDEDGAPLSVDEQWELILNDFYGRNLKSTIKLTDKQIKQIDDKAKVQESISLKEDFIDLFSQKSYVNEVAGECLFYSFIMVLLRKRKVKLGITKSTNNDFILPLPVIWMQKSGTGKDQALDFIEELIKQINHQIDTDKSMPPEDRLELEIQFENLSGGESPEVYFDRPKLKKDGGVKYSEATGEMEVAHGKLYRNDVLLVRECSFLFRQADSERQNVLEILLQTLEGRQIGKELVSWNGKVINTKANCAFIGVSRPVPQVQEIITNSGLLQRGLFYAREITLDDQQEMDKRNKIINEKESKEYYDAFIELARKITSFYLKINPYTFKLENPDLCNELFQQYIKQKRDFIFMENFNDLVKDALDTFINRTKDLAIKLAFVNCYARGGNQPDEVDIKGALNTLDKLFNHLTVWLENKLVEDMKVSVEKKNWEFALRKAFKDKKIIGKADLLKEIATITKCTSTQTIYARLNRYVGPNKLFREIGNKQYMFNA